tara:strand:+ start:285323 stop:285481 length:159 start_codon:yes stop_codon:yes gene_type:complete
MQKFMRHARLWLSLPVHLIALIFFAIATGVMALSELIAASKPPPSRKQVQAE